MKRLGALCLAGALSLISATALADLAGAPGTGGAGGGTGGSGGGGTGGTGDGGKKDSGGCAASPGTASGSAALALGLGLLFAIPAARRRGKNRPDKRRP